MNLRLIALGALAFALVLAGCAAAFKPVNRDDLHFIPAPADSASLPVGYRFHTLEDSFNYRYSAKARKVGIQFVAVKITNNQNRPLVMKTDVSYFLGATPVAPTEIRNTYPYLRQKTGAYAFYLLLMPVNLYRTELACDGFFEDCRTETTMIPVGLILGPALALGNMIQSADANEKFATEFVRNDLYEKVLQPGETAVGYLALRDIGTAPLVIRPR